MKIAKSALLAALVGIALGATPALAKKGKDMPPGHAKKVVAVQTVTVKGAGHGFSRTDSELVRAYFAANPTAMTALPPGIAMNYARGKPLPPGIAKKILPPALLAQLPPRPGYHYAQIGRDVVLIETATKLVVDIIRNVFD